MGLGVRVRVRIRVRVRVRVRVRGRGRGRVRGRGRGRGRVHLVAVLQVLLRVWLAQVDPQPVGADDVARAGEVGRTVVDELGELLDVEGRDELGVGQVARDRARHSHLVDGEVGVGRDHLVRVRVRGRGRGKG